MDTLLAFGDHKTDGCGLPVVLTGAQEIIQRALIRLSVKKGSFAPDPALGSELHRLRPGTGQETNRTALSYAQEALAPLGARVLVLAAQCSVPEPEKLLIKLRIAVDNEPYQLEVNAG